MAISTLIALASSFGVSAGRITSGEAVKPAGSSSLLSPQPADKRLDQLVHECLCNHKAALAEARSLEDLSRVHAKTVDTLMMLLSSVPAPTAVGDQSLADEEAA